MNAQASLAQRCALGTSSCWGLCIATAGLMMMWQLQDTWTAQASCDHLCTRLQSSVLPEDALAQSTGRPSVPVACWSACAQQLAFLAVRSQCCASLCCRHALLALTILTLCLACMADCAECLQVLQVAEPATLMDCYNVIRLPRAPCNSIVKL